MDPVELDFANGSSTTGCSEANLDFSDRPYMAKNDFLGKNSEFFINLG